MFEKKKALNFLYWMISGIFIILFIYLLMKLFPAYGVVISFLWKLFSPFLVACLIAYLLHPIISKMHELNMPKGLAILLIYIFFFGGIAYGIYRVYPTIVHEVRDLNEQLPHFVDMYSDLVYKLYEYTSFLPETVHDKIDQLIERVEGNVDRFLSKVVGGFTKIFDMIVFITVIPVLVFYFLKDYDKIKSYMKRWIPEKYQKKTSNLVHAVDDSLGNYLRGLLIVSLFVSVSTFVVFHFLHIKYALLLAIIMGLTNIIPYFGPIIGAVPVVAITLTISGKLVIIVLIAIFVIQLIESNLLSPYIVGKSIQIHPIAIIFALLLGGQLGGVVGMIIAVPALTVLKVMMTHLLAFKR